MIIICTPTKDTIHSGTAFDLVQLVKHSPEANFAVSQGTILPNQRTNLIRKVIESHAGHVLFIDSDMRFPEDTIDKLLSHKKDIIGANCKHRQANKWTAGISSRGKTGIQEVDNIGFGVTLIRTEVFIKMAEPWFATPYDGVQFVGEDVFFCRKAKEMGYKIFIDHDLSQDVKHIGSYEFGTEEKK